jgi:dTDP-4-amino-4,6-dideoxygalactose transaminase
VYNYYLDAFSDLVSDDRLKVPTVPSNCQTNHHIFYLVVNSETERDELVAHLKDRGIGAAQHYEPLHTSPMGRKLGYEPGDLAVTERVAARLLRLPVHTNVTVADRRHVVTAVKSFFG